MGATQTAVSVWRVSALRVLANPISESGYSITQTYATLREKLDSHGSTILPMLDEVVHLYRG